MNKKVFIVDDSIVANKMTESLVKKFFPDLETVCFTDPDKALDELKPQKPFLLLLDYQMPKIDGKAFMVRLSELLCFGDTTIFLVTGMDFDDQEAMTMATIGISKMFKKPVAPEKLKVAIELLISEVEQKTA